MHNLKVWLIGILISCALAAFILLIFNPKSNNLAEPKKVYKVLPKGTSEPNQQKADVGATKELTTSNTEIKSENNNKTEILKTDITKQGAPGVVGTKIENQKVTPQEFMDAIRDKLEEYKKRSATIRSESKASIEHIKATQHIWDEIAKINKQINALFPDSDIGNYESHLLSMGKEGGKEFLKKFMPLLKRKMELYNQYKSYK